MKLMNNYTPYFLATMIAGVSLFAACSGETENVSASQAEVRAEVATAELERMQSDKVFNATLSSDVRSEIGTKVMAEVEAVPAKIGEKVAKGALILKLKDEALTAQKQQASAGLEEANLHLKAVEKDYQRFKALHEQGSATEKEWDDVSTQYQSAQLKVEAAKSKLAEINDMLSYTQIKAPYAGVVAAKYVQVGDIVAPGRPLIAIEEVGNFKIVASLPETEISSLQKGEKVSVRIPAIHSEVMEAEVRNVSASGDPQSRQFEAEFMLTDAGKLEDARSGMFAEVMLKEETEIAVTVPASALIHRGQLRGIYTLTEDNKAVLRWLRTGDIQDGKVAILSGLTAGERYVKDGSLVPHDGVKVTAQN